jgi:16S rRNA (cytosine1402-N4)-methyltransferase
MRMNPARGQSASAFLRGIDAAKLARLLEENSDEPQAERLAPALAGKSFPTTLSLASAIRAQLFRFSEEAVELTVRRVFQALRIAVNDEFSALDSLLRQLPSCLNPGGRVAILTFHSGEDRRVKKSFASGRAAGLYSQISDEVIRPTVAEKNANPRSSSAKLRWARRST